MPRKIIFSRKPCLTNVGKRRQSGKVRKNLGLKMLAKKSKAKSIRLLLAKDFFLMISTTQKFFLLKAKQSARIDARPDQNIIMSLQKIATSEAFRDFHLKVGLYPIYMQYWSKMQIDIYNRLVKSENPLIISLDATGSIITPVPNNKRIYLYHSIIQAQ